MNDKLNILGLAHRFSGCHYHRVTLPLGFMDNIDGLVTDSPTQELLEQNNYDLLLYNRGCAFNDGWHILKDKIGIVMDLDDDWILPPNHMNYQSYLNVKPVIENNIRIADIVTVTNERLADRVYPLNNNVYVLPNALPYGQDQFISDKEPDQDGKLRIFWAGGISHEHDIRILRNPFKRLVQYKDKIKMVLGGYSLENEYSQRIWDRMYSSFTGGDTLDGVRIEGLPPRHYMNTYRFADIMVVPLESSDWHACKSNLKLLEAACKGVPVIVSNVEPYSRDPDAPVLWVNKQSDWYDHLKFLINNENARIDYGEKLKAWATERYNIKEINTTRRKLFADIVARIRGIQKSSSYISEAQTHT